MSVTELVRSTRPSAMQITTVVAATLIALALWQPVHARETLVFVVMGLVQITPIVIPGILLAAWIRASGASDRVVAVFHGRPVQTVMAATVIGALLPVCGVTVLPLMVGLLAAGVPLAPVMAFWLASPVTDPALLSATVATLGWEFAVGKTLVAIGLGLLGGCATGLFGHREWARAPLRSNGLVNALGAAGGGCESGVGRFEARIWRDPATKRRFAKEAWSISRLMVLVLTPAFAAEFLLNSWLQPDVLAGYVGRDSALAVPLAVIVGGPAYLDGFAALPLTRALLELGMSPAAAMAFLVSGGVVSIWGAMAIFPVLRLKPFLFYLALAIVGSMLSGWAFDALY